MGLPPAMAETGCKLIDPGRCQTMSDDFPAQISVFKKAKVEIASGVSIPPDFTTF
ncbi:hypothetical protein [Poseidonocella sp. HB161398]|uniref:hypothetical protein n=1 Tax=Poseidonocella sp. HB161398 TaxID=2320855 RepID=UPI0019817CE7|nr:hypothetical protein [Poseidonocella sp. HB161398]